MKASLNQIVNIIIMAAIAFIIGRAWYKERENRITAENNLSASEVYHNQQKDLTKKQAKEFYGGVLTILGDKLGVKPKQITGFIQGEVQYRDTGSTKVIERTGDTILVYPDSLTGSIERPCYTLDWLLYKGYFTEYLDYHDSITLAMYRERPHKFLFIKYGRWINKAEIYSGCNGSTIKVFNNVKIRGR